MDNAISGLHIPDDRDQQHCSDVTVPSMPLALRQILEQQYAVTGIPWKDNRTVSAPWNRVFKVHSQHLICCNACKNYPRSQASPVFVLRCAFSIIYRSGRVIKHCCSLRGMVKRLCNSTVTFIHTCTKHTASQVRGQKLLVLFLFHR